MDSCRLCGNEAPLRKSHIYPEFLYELMYDEKHRFEVVQLGEQATSRTVQKGLRERLLCDGCEQQIGRYERYAKQVLIEVIDPTWRLEGGYLVRDGVDYARFKLFLLSLLWRAGVSTLNAFHEVSLGTHEPVLRDLLRREDPGAAGDYPTLLQAFSRHAELMAGTLVPPFRIEVDGHSIYQSVFVAVQCTTAVVRGMSLDSNETKVLSPSGILAVKVMPPDLEEDHIRHIARRLHESPGVREA